MKLHPPDLVNGVALVACLVLASLGALWAVERPTADRLVPEEQATQGGVDTSARAGVLRDARGKRVEARPYERIVSLNTVADFVLLDLVEPHRLVAVSRWAAEDHPDGWRFADPTVLDTSGEVEAIIALRPDLVVVSNFVGDARIQRLEESGIAVFDLGEMRGVDSTLADIELLATLVEEPRRGRQLQARMRRELAGLSAALEGVERPWGLYLSNFGDSFFGGTAGTSYEDLFRYGGVRDLAAKHGHSGWPQYSAEQILSMDPRLIITQEGMAEVLCRHAAVGSIAACGPDGRIVELTGAYHSDPGLGLVTAAAQLQRKLHWAER